MIDRFSSFYVWRTVLTSLFGIILSCLIMSYHSSAENSRPTSLPVLASSRPVTVLPTTATSPPQQTAPKTTDSLDRAMFLAEKLLIDVLWKHGRDSNNPWLLAHTLLALGQDFQLPNKQSAIDRIVSGFVRFKKVGQVEYPYFPEGDATHRVEPHPSMHLKTFLELGVPLHRSFRVGQRTVTLQQILHGVYLQFPHHPEGREMGTQAWRFFLLYGQLPENNRAWAWDNAQGQRVIFLRQVFRLMKYVNQQTSFLRVLKSRGVEVIPKLSLRRQHIYGESCGGFHLLQAAFRWMQHPALKKRLTSMLEDQTELLFYRLEGETKLYTQLFKKYQQHAAYRFIILLQQLKFLGHFLETVHHMHRWGLITPSKTQRAQIRSAIKLTVVSIMLLQRLGWYERIPLLQQRSYQLYLDLLGDSAHALHALRDIRGTSLYHK